MAKHFKRGKHPIYISVGARKGGVGKSFISMNLCGYLISNYNARALLVGCDTQEDIPNRMLSTNEYGPSIPEYFRKNHLSLADVLFNGYDIHDAIYKTREYPLIHEGLKRSYIKGETMHLDILPAGKELTELKIPEKTDDNGNVVIDAVSGNPVLEYMAFKDVFEPIEDEYDFIIFDLPPSEFDGTILAFAASDYIIVPIDGLDSLDSWEEVNELVADLRICGSNVEVLGAVHNKVKTRWNLPKYIEGVFNENWSGQMFTQYIVEDPNKELAASYGIPLCAFRKTKAGHQLWKLTDEVLRRIEKKEKEKGRL